jgi:hypothetical protein
MLEENLLLNINSEICESPLTNCENNSNYSIDDNLLVDLTKTIEELSFVNPSELNDSLNFLEAALGELSNTNIQTDTDNFSDRALNSNLDPITGQALDKAFDYLSKLKDDSELDKKLELAFGDSFDRDLAEKLITDFSKENFTDLPSLEIISGKNINGANGAFAAATNTIYLSSEFVANSKSTDAIASVILEEIGHYLDSQINYADSSGDEGDIFSRTVRGEQIDAQELNALKIEDDSTVMFDGDREIAIEQSTIPIVTIATIDSSAAETTSGQTSNPASFRISRTGSTTSNLTVNYTIGGSATKGSDYSSSNITGTITIAAGATSADLVLNVIDDAIAEYKETVTITLADNAMYTVGTSKVGTATITDNEAPIVLLSVKDAIATETIAGQTIDSGAFTIARTGNSANALTVKYTVSGKATNGVDYSQLSGNITIPAGVAAVNLPINILDDFSAEYAETVTLTLAEDPSYTLSTTNKTGTVTIQDNEAPVVFLSVKDGTAAETTSIPLQAKDSGAFTIARTGNNTNALTVNYTVSGTATNGVDYDNLTGSITIGAGVTAVNLPINVLDDSIFEGNETVTVSLASSNNYLLGTAKTGTVTIQDNDPAPFVTLLTPNGGENLKTGYNYGITWNDNFSGNVKIDLYKGGVFNQTIFSSTASDGSENWSISDSLIAGSDYSIKVFSLDNNSVFDTSNNYFTISKDWFVQNLSDSGIIGKMRTLTADNLLSRNDAIALLNDTKDNDTIDQIEFSDLQKILTNAGMFNAPDYVKVLTNKVVNGDVANANYQKTTLGNLSAGSSASHMEKLINKWFLGLDRPDTTDVDGVTYTYKFVSGGSLFQNGVSYQDIYQGYVGDCYFLAALASTAFRSPSTIQSMFTDNGDNTYTVRFYNNGVADYVTVDRYLPVDGYGTFIYARQKAASWGAPGDAANEWWYALAEKAYAQLNESGWTGQDGTNSYSGIIAGWEGNTIKQVTGLNTTVGGSMNFDNIVNAFNSGKWITIGSKFSGVANNVVVGHAYVLVGYNPGTSNNTETAKFTLFNPWGVGADSSKPGLLELSWTELLASFSDWTRTV